MSRDIPFFCVNQVLVLYIPFIWLILITIDS